MRAIKVILVLVGVAFVKALVNVLIQRWLGIEILRESEAKYIVWNSLTGLLWLGYWLVVMWAFGWPGPWRW